MSSTSVIPAAIKRTRSQVILPPLTYKTKRLHKALHVGVGLPSGEKMPTKPVTLVIGINKHEATPPRPAEGANASIPVALAAIATPESKPKRRARKAATVIAPLPLLERKWITVKEAAALYPKSEQAFRHLIHQSSRQARYPDASLPSFGFEKCVLRQPGSRNVYLLVEELDRWMAQGQGGVQ